MQFIVQLLKVVESVGVEMHKGISDVTCIYEYKSGWNLHKEL